MKAKLCLGDVVEIPTKKGFAYAQYTHTHTEPPQYGDLIRILEGFYQKRPDRSELQKLVDTPQRFSTFVPLKEAVRDGTFEVVANLNIPRFAQDFPIFKGTNQYNNPEEHEIIWWLWDGKKEWKAGKLPLEDQKKYPELITFNEEGLIIAIETGRFGDRLLC